MIYNDQISSFQDFLIKIIPLLFTILISSHLPLKFLKLSVIQLQPLLTIYLPRIILFTIYLLHIIVTSLLLQVRTVHSGQNSIRYHDPLICNVIPRYIKDFETLDIFKGKIQKWKAINCPLLPLQKIYTKSRLHKSDLVQYFFLKPSCL